MIELIIKRNQRYLLWKRRAIAQMRCGMVRTGTGRIDDTEQTIAELSRQARELLAANLILRGHVA